MKKNLKKTFYNFNEITKNNHFEGYPIYTSTFQNKILNHALHSHNFIEIILVHSGNGIHFTEYGSCPLTTRDVFVIPRGIKHGYKDLHDVEMTNITFQMKTIEKYFPQLMLMPGFSPFSLANIVSKEIHKEFHSVVNLNKKNFDILAQLSAQIQHEVKQALPGAKTMSMLNFGKIILLLSRLYEQKQNETLDKSDYSRLAQVYAYINTNFKDRLRISKLAHIACMSERNFQRFFTKTNGTNPSTYIMKIRLENALNELHNSNLPISEIAFNSGFTDCSYFSSQFKKAYNISPRQYQKTVKSRSLFKSNY